MKNLLTFVVLNLFLSIKAQIGVNTSNPQAALHIDGMRDNNLSGIPTVTQQTNDIVVTQQGRLGIGTTFPSVNLEVNSGISNSSGVRLTRLPSSSVLATDANGTVISGNTEFTGVSVTKQRMVNANSELVLNSGSGAYSFRYTGTTVGGQWQIKVNNGVTRTFNIWDIEYRGENGVGAYNNVYQLRTVKDINPNEWTNLDNNIAGGADEYNVYHVYDLGTGIILRFTCTLSNVSGIKESMILEEF
ncbi:hypothetical protein [Chryseobacterium bernardetii]|uniref:Uncharacterized protein n=1 Tax=Chryseobacterium bernardetii TaxID=1241978 RepID=A0A3G6TDS6_9FLAO|nr:hypothetical protein [Chryseobacterium bernardetii]AZB27401.1 hypothetical protein EG339_23820 [Chryseobacterium bernardetii]